MHVGILGGTGPAGRALAARLAAAGAEVTLGSRSPDRARDTVAELVKLWPERDLTIEPADNSGAARARTVVVATPWDGAVPTVETLAGALSGKVVVSMANALVRIGGELQPLLPPRGSIAVAVQGAAPEALVSAAFHHLPAKELGDLARPMGADVLICSDHRTATDVTADLVRMVPGLRPLDAGSLSAAGAIESMTAVVLSLNSRYKTRASLRITGID